VNAHCSMQRVTSSGKSVRLVRVRSQRGAALISVIFLIVFIAALGAFAIRTGLDYQQQASLSLQEVRVAAAAYSGVEVAAYRWNNGGSCAGGPISIAGQEGMAGIRVAINSCTPLTPAPDVVVEIDVTAAYGNFGNPDFVQRRITRRVGNIGGGSSWE
jgi:Tfp pilus assembly protein PilX